MFTYRYDINIRQQQQNYIIYVELNTNNHLFFVCNTLLNE